MDKPTQNQPHSSPVSSEDALTQRQGAFPRTAPSPSINATLNLSSEPHIPLHFVEVEISSDGGGFCTPVHLEDMDSSLWTNTLVGFFLGKKLPFAAVNKLAHMIWDTKGLKDAILHRNGIYFFRF